MFETNIGGPESLDGWGGVSWLRRTDHKSFSHEFLKTNEIVPGSWDIRSSQIEIQTGQSQITYENGVTFQLNGNHIHIYEDCAAQFKGDYLVFELADRYLEKDSWCFCSRWHNS